MLGKTYRERIFSSIFFAASAVLNITPEIVCLIIYFLNRNVLLCKSRAHNVMFKYYMENDLLIAVNVSRSFKYPPEDLTTPAINFLQMTFT